MNPRDLLESAFNAVALDPAVFAQTITHYPLGDRTAGVDVTAIVHGTEQEARSDDDEHGSAIVRQLTITLPTAVTVTVAERPQQRDTFLINGELWLADAVLHRTSYRQQVRCKRTEAASSKRSRV